MIDRFDLEQQIMETWGIIRDIQLLTRQGASAESFSALATVYEHKFQEVWDTFENVSFPHAESADKVTPDTQLNSTGIASTTLVTDDEVAVSVSYGDYDGEKILGIDTPLESVSFVLADLEPLIEVLRVVQRITPPSTESKL